MSIRLLLVLVMTFAIAPAGCNQPARAPDAPRAVKNVYGISLTLDLRDATDAQEYYTVDRDGQLGFAGGMNARFERITYTTELSSDDMRLLRETIERERLLDGSLSSSNQPKSVYFRITLKMDDRSLHKTIKGDNARLEALRSVLKDFANRRLEPELERQPKPSAATRPAASPPSN